MFKKKRSSFASILSGVPRAAAEIRGSGEYPEIRGTVKFFESPAGVLVCAEIFGLEISDSAIFAFHIHEGASCTGDASDPFSAALSHYNPHSVPHPYHAGDLPPLFDAGGMAYSVVLTNRFKTGEILGKTVIIHSKRDDFTTQPSGDAGKKIACGKIYEIRRTRLS